MFPIRLAWYSWLIGFGFTLAFERPLALWLLRNLEPRWWRRLLVILFANLLTHPLVWFFFPLLPLSYTVRVCLSEIWAFGIKAIFCGALTSQPRPLRALLASVVANGSSFGLGWLIVSRCAHWFY